MIIAGETENSCQGAVIRRRRAVDRKYWAEGRYQWAVELLKKENLFQILSFFSAPLRLRAEILFKKR